MCQLSFDIHYSVAVISHYVALTHFVPSTHIPFPLLKYRHLSVNVWYIRLASAAVPGVST